MLLLALAGCPWLPCDDALYADADGDGLGDVNAPRTTCPQTGWVGNHDDCDDQDAAVGTGDPWYFDADGDLHGDPEEVSLICPGENPGSGVVSDSGDCDDADPTVYPGAVEVCDQVDDDCDGAVDDADDDVAYTAEETWYPDGDGDGYGDAVDEGLSACVAPEGYLADHTDCDDGAAYIHEGSAEDHDADGTPACTDCDDNDPSKAPGLTEIVGDGVDEDCSGTELCYADADGDGYRDAAGSTSSSSDTDCNDMYEASERAPDGDCEDLDATINPDAPEACDALDHDCDGLSGSDGDDVPDAPSWYTDADADGYGDDDTLVQACAQPSDTVTEGGDCDDAAVDVHPGATETLDDGIDQDCDGVDDTTPCLDADGDGQAAATCGGTDCDDTRASVYPGAAETAYDGVDQDCDGADLDDVDGDGSAYPDDCDDADPAVHPGAADAWYDGVDADCGGNDDNDADADGWDLANDCDEADSAVNPGAAEICDDGVDQDCDPADDACVYVTCYADLDADGFGDPATASTAAGSCPAGTSTDDTDCDDADPAVYPLATETCNGVDDDCDGDSDEGLPTYTYADDADADGYGDLATSGGSGCVVPSGAVTAFGDCDDADPAVHPLAAETCNGIDDDCDGGVDTYLASYTYYDDADGDGYGDPATEAVDCAIPAGATTDSTDCDDADATSYPGGTDTCGDGVDQDCDGADAPCLASGSLADAITWTGEASGDEAGYGMSGACDVNGDGLDDLLVTAFQSDTPYNDAGAVYVVYGSLAPAGGTLSAADVVLRGRAPNDGAGISIDCAGDLDSDGVDDFIVGDHLLGSGGVHPGGAFLVRSSDSVSSLADAVLYVGNADYDYAGSAVAGGGDFDGDGVDDLYVGAEGVSGTTDYDGAAYVLPGDSVSGGLLLSSSWYYQGLGGYAGEAVASPGDMDGDGYDELVVGAYNADYAGKAYVVRGGPAPASASLSAADATFSGEVFGDDAGYTISGAGDLDADGRADLLIGAQYNADGGASAGTAYLILGASSLADRGLGAADAIWTGSEVDGYAGTGIGGGGDVNGDGTPDLAIGAPFEDGAAGANSGVTYVWSGADSLGGSLADAPLAFDGAAANDNAGRTVSNAGDVNGDGFDEILIGAPFGGAGSVYLVLGGAF